MKITCSYRNDSHQVQIIKICEITFHLEKTLYPGQIFQFESEPYAYLQINTFEMITAILADKIRCDRLQTL